MQNLLQAAIDLAGEFEIGQQQVDTDGYPDLGRDRILGGPKKTLDLYILLAPFEKEFDLPTDFVDLRNGVYSGETGQ